MVSVALSLLLVLAVVQAFDLLGGTISEGRAKMELATRLRRATNILQRDLDSITCPVQPWIDPDAGSGYFEYVEGISRDYSIDVDFDEAVVIGSQSQDIFGPSHLGDLDDVLFMTVRSGATPFRGRGPNGTVESTMAEVVWWVAFLDANNNDQLDSTDSPMLMRRVLLIRPDAWAPNAPPPVGRFFANYDISARVEFDDASGTPYMVANSMSDLANRRNRFAHQIQATATVPNPFPNRVQFLPWVNNQLRTATYYFSNGPSSPPAAINACSFLPRLISHDELSNEAADWFVTSDLLAFDVRAYDPDARVYLQTDPNSNVRLAVVPGDYHYFTLATATNPAATVVGNGAYVDLGPIRDDQGQQLHVVPLMRDPNRPLDWGPPPPPPAPQIPDVRYWIYDTWSLGYERDGFDQDNDNTIDQGTNGLDDNDNGLVDELDERETQPPYNVPLRGLEVRVRAIDVESRQVRQTSVVGDFTR